MQTSCSIKIVTVVSVPMALLLSKKRNKLKILLAFFNTKPSFAEIQASNNAIF